MRKRPRSGSPTSGSPVSAKAADTAANSARNGASTSASYTSLRGLNQAGSLWLRSPLKKAKAAGRNPAKAPIASAIIVPHLNSKRFVSLSAPGADQELAVAGGTKHRALGDADHGPARLIAEPGGDAVADRLVHRRVAHDPALPDLARAGLELRLDQRHERRALGRQRQRRRQYRLQTDKARIADDQVDRLCDLGAAQIAGVDALMHNDARVLAQFPGKLPAADIDRMHAGGAMRQQHVGEAAGRGADIERGAARRVEAEMIECKGELQPAARYPRMVAAGERERRVLIERSAALVDAPACGADQAGENQGLRLGPAFGEPLLDQQLVGA